MESDTIKKGIVVTASLTLLSFLLSVMSGRLLFEAVLATARTGLVLFTTLLLFLVLEEKIISQIEERDYLFVSEIIHCLYLYLVCG